MKKQHRTQALAAKAFGALSAICLVFAIAGFQAAAATTGVVSSTSGANVRSEADTSSDLVASLEADAEVEVTDSTESGDYTWYYVTFTYEGSETSGWIRGDLLTVTETDEEEEEDTESEDTESEETEETASGTTINGYTVSEPEEAYEDASSMDSTTVELSGSSYTAYMPTDGTEIYLVWAENEDGDSGWYWYDPDEETFQQDLGQFSSSGLITALQSELTTLKETSTSKLATRMYIIIALGVAAAVLLIIVSVLLIRNRDIEYIYEDEDEVPDDWYKDGEDEEGAVDEEEPRKSKKEKKNKKDKKAEDAEDAEEEPRQNQSYTTGDLPEIDISGVFDETKKTGEDVKPVELEDEGLMAEDDDFSDIEILDLEDLGL